GRTPSRDDQPMQDAGYGQYSTEPLPHGVTYLSARLEVKVVRYLDVTAAALEAIDRVLESSSGEPEPSPITSSHAVEWACDPQLLDLFQDLLAASVTDNPPMALRRIEHLEDELRIHQGIATLRYDPADEETEGLFDILPAPPGAPAAFVT